jgi:hypothetical protein
MTNSTAPATSTAFTSVSHFDVPLFTVPISL